MRTRHDETELDSSSLKSVQNEIGETEEKRKRSLQILKKNLSEVSGLNPCLDDIFLLRFLRVSKFDCSKAYNRILKFYQHHKAHPNVYGDFLPSAIVKAKDTRNLFVLPFRAKDNSVILVCQRKIYDSTAISYDEIVRMHMLMLETLLMNPVTQMCGATIIVDLRVSANLSEYTPSRLRFISELLKNGSAARVKAIHIVNIPSIFYLLYSLAHPFFPAKIKNRLILHSRYDNWKSLHSHIPPDNLTEEYGGNLKPCDVINIVDKLIENEDHFRKRLQYGFKDIK
ncbi:alpha-tocopherol transfer protein-like [Uloborus diversus]|uniref:alpha-tocopherol transfer protein-like n=1 Tax=Uloborus diversus TaxID=327109 RepID=UPI0024090183|nr:alpha-tocopherol transfer protein-like [Uloborus diversus]XP_054717971.1 alpha-tocopherol transfer protein-like [Uloborus diversus]